MPIACTLGLAACLTFAGSDYTAETATQILDECDLLRRYPVSTFVDHPMRPGEGLRRAVIESNGYLSGELLERKGLKLAWPPGPGQRQAAWSATCALFEQAYNTPGLWKNVGE